MAQLKHPIREAERYLQNAKQLLSEKAEKDGDHYNDSKHVKTAGNIAWNGVLVAMDAVLNVRENLKKGQRLDFKDYQLALWSKDNKMNKYLLNAYDLLHKSLGYDGVTNYRVVQESMNYAKILINWADKHYQE